MSDTDFPRIWLAEFLRDMRKREKHVALCLKHVKNPQSNYAEGFRVMLRVYERAIAHAESELAALPPLTEGNADGNSSSAMGNSAEGHAAGDVSGTSQGGRDVPSDSVLDRTPARR